MKDPSYEQFRKNMVETKGVSKAADALSLCFGDDWNQFGERYLRGQMVKKLRGIMDQGSGFKGERNFEAAAHLADFKRFQLNRAAPFKSRFNAPFTVDVNADRNTATLDVPNFVMRASTGLAPYATHFRLFMTIGVLTDFVFVGGEELYAPAHDDLVGLRSRDDSAALTKGSVAGFQLIATLPGLPVLPPDAYLVVCVGVQYLQVIGGREEVFAGRDSMQIYAAY